MLVGLALKPGKWIFNIAAHFNGFRVVLGLVALAAATLPSPGRYSPAAILGSVFLYFLPCAMDLYYLLAIKPFSQTGAKSRDVSLT